MNQLRHQLGMNQQPTRGCSAPYHLLIGGMTSLNYQDEFPMVSALMYVMHTGQDLG